MRPAVSTWRRWAAFGKRWSWASPACAAAGEALAVDPHLPEEWSRLAFPLRFRGSTLRLSLEHERLGITVEDVPLSAILAGHRLVLQPGEHCFERVAGAGWRPVGEAHEERQP